MNGFRTIPELALAWGAPLDRLREFLRARPDLASLGTRVGPTRAFAPEAAEAVRAEYEKSRKPRAVGTSA